MPSLSSGRGSHWVLWLRNGRRVRSSFEQGRRLLAGIGDDSRAVPTQRLLLFLGWLPEPVACRCCWVVLGGAGAAAAAVATKVPAVLSLLLLSLLHLVPLLSRLPVLVLLVLLVLLVTVVGGGGWRGWPWVRSRRLRWLLGLDGYRKHGGVELTAFRGLSCLGAQRGEQRRQSLTAAG